MDTNKTSHTPFDDMLEPESGLFRAKNCLSMRRMMSPISTYGLTFALGAAFVFLGASAMRRTLPAPVMPTPLPTAMARVSIEPGPVVITSPPVYPTLAPTPTAAPRQVVEPTSEPVEAPVSVPREEPVARPAVPRPTPIPKRRLTPPRRIETAVAPLPEIRIPRISLPRVKPTEKPQPHYYPEFDPVHEANEDRRVDRRQDFEDEEFEEYHSAPAWREEDGDWRPRGRFRSHRWEEEMPRRHMGPRDNDLGEWDDDDYSGRAWGRAGGRGKKWKEKWRD